MLLLFDSAEHKARGLAVTGRSTCSAVALCFSNVGEVRNTSEGVMNGQHPCLSM